MKKLFAIALTLVMVACVCVTAAASGSFVSSPSNNQAPTVITYTTDNDDCVAVVICTAYADRDELKQETREKLEAAYETIINTPDLSVLNENIEDVAKQLGAMVENLAVSDMFDISATDCGVHEDHGHFEIVLKPESLENFVCLLHYYNGEWRIVENARINEEGHLEFEEDEFSPFAIVVDTDNGTCSFPWIWILVAAGALIIFFIIIWKKSKKDEKETPTA